MRMQLNKGLGNYTTYCYKHGERVAYNGEVKEIYQRPSVRGL